MRAKTLFAALPEDVPVPDDFIEELYQALNPDVAAAVSGGQYASPYAHWQAVGAAQTAQGKRPLLANEAWYNPDAKRRVPAEQEVWTLDTPGYLHLNPDVKAQIGDNADAARMHWLEHGRHEQRQAPGIAPFRHRRIDFSVMANKPFGLNIFGPFMAPTGLGAACRNMAAAIKQTRLPFEVWNFDTKNGPARMAEIDKQRAPRFKINIIFANADQIETLFAVAPEGFFNDAYNIAIWQWELAAFRPDWFACFGAIDEVWTNSKFQETAIRAAAPVPVRHIALPVIKRVPAGRMTRQALGIAEEHFLFLLVFDVGSTIARKNPFAAIAAFKSVFKPGGQVSLLIKYQTPEHDEGFSLALCKMINGCGHIHVIAETIGDGEIADLQVMADCLVAPHRAEGFGLNIAEFMALGKPVIATNYSGNVDFLDEFTGYPVDYRLTEIYQMTGPYPAGYVWAEPDEAGLATAMSEVAGNREQAAARGANAASRMRDMFSPAHIAWDIIARLRQLELDQPLPAYAKWIGRSSCLRAASPLWLLADQAGQRLPGFAANTLISVLVPVYNVAAEYLELCLQSVLRQNYPLWELCIANDASSLPETREVLNRYRGISPRIKIHDAVRNEGIAMATNRAAGMAVGAYLAFLDNDDVLHPDALLDVARAIDRDAQVDCLYTDEVKIDEYGNVIDHFYKPDFSPEHLESVMYVLHLLVVRKALFFDVGQLRTEFDGAQDYDLMLRMSRCSSHITHISRALYSWRAIAGSAAAVVDAKPYALAAGLRALQDHVAQKYPGARVEPGRLTGTFRVRRMIPPGLKVTLVVLTNNQVASVPGRGTVNLLENFIRTIRQKTTYPHYEIMVVDNASLRSSQVEALRADGIEVVDYGQHDRFNYAAKANFAVRAARTEMLVLLNDDMEVINSGWLHALLEFGVDPEIGAVGARLLRADDTVQHVGAVIGLHGGVGHVYHNAQHDFVGYNGFTHIIRNFSAVTGACLAVRKTVVINAGGFDEQFAIDYNDIDLCLKLRRAGYRIVYTPYAELYHFERLSITQKQQSPAERDCFRARWKNLLEDDPYYNINLTRGSLDYALAD